MAEIIGKRSRPAKHLHSLWRRASPLHRRRVCLGRGHSAHCNDRQKMETSARAEPTDRAPAPDHTEAKVRNEDEDLGCRIVSALPAHVRITFYPESPRMVLVLS